ncbi:MAG: penicillin-binding protein activator LpoB [Niabella sp.]
MKIAHTILLLLTIIIFSCGRKPVQRVQENTTIDLNTRWNQTDARLTAETMVSQLLEEAWYKKFISTHGAEKPRLIVDMIINQSSEHIDTKMFTEEIKRDLINSGSVKMVNDGVLRESMRAERADQQINANEKTRKKLQNENGADYVLQGYITSNVQTDGRGQKTVYYQVNLELSDIESSDNVWVGSKKIFKYAGKKNYKNYKTND